MIELIQFPWSPFCLVQRRILEYSGVPFKITNVPNADRSLVWRLTRQRYYGVPIIKDGRNVIFETDNDSQVIAKYIDTKFKLNLFPRRWFGVQRVLWCHIEDKIEDPCFRLNDIYWKEMVPKSEQVAFLRHKERKFGRGCIDQWRAQKSELQQQLTQRLLPYELMLGNHPYLLDTGPCFVDFDLWGMLANFLYSGHYRLPKNHTRLNQWYTRMSQLKKAK